VVTASAFSERRLSLTVMVERGAVIRPKHEPGGTAMEHYAAIDVSLEWSSVCVVNAAGQIVCQDGRLRRGHSGNPAGKPKGTRHKATLAVEAILDGEADALTGRQSSWRRPATQPRCAFARNAWRRLEKIGRCKSRCRCSKARRMRARRLLRSSRPSR
jgi:hypothetical protein